MADVRIGSTYVLGQSLYSEAISTGTLIGAVRNDDLAALADTDNEVAPLQVNASGALYVTGGGGGTEYTLGTDTYTEATSVATLAGVVRSDTLASLVDTDNELTSLQVDVNGALYTNTDVTLIAGVAIATGTGVVGAGTQRVTLADNDVAVALLTTIDTDTGVIAGDTTSIDGKITACDTGAVVIASGTVTTVSTVTNLVQMNGAAISMDTGPRDAGTQRVTIATNDSVPTVEAAPTSPAIDVSNADTPVTIAPNTPTDVDSPDLVTKKLRQATVTSTVPFKVIFSTLSAGSPTTKAVRVTGEGEQTIEWNTPHKDYAVSGTTVGGFRARITNLDPADTADFYVTFAYED
jgi:hypothetical protein